MTDPFAPAEQEPASIMIGAYASWRSDLTFDPLVYSVKSLFLKGDTTNELVAEYVDGCWVFTAPSAFTSQLPAGRNTLNRVIRRLSDNEQIVVGTSTVQCFQTQVERESHSQVMVDKIESILSNRADSDVESYTIKSRSISKMSVKELIEWRDYYLAELGREPDAVTGKRPNNNTLRVGFI